MHPLDNAAWRALTGPQAHLAERVGGAARFQPEVGVFCGLPDDPTADDWADLATLVGTDAAIPFRPHLDVPDGWQVHPPVACFQLWATGEVTRSPALSVRDVVTLGPADTDEAIALIEATKPGPFRRRTMELGTYLGIRVGGRLAAMAGERMRLDGFTEISAVATHPRHRGEGLASALVLELVDRIHERDDVPFLHVAEDNVGALRLYEHLGFAIRADISVSALTAPGVDAG